MQAPSPRSLQPTTHYGRPVVGNLADVLKRVRGLQELLVATNQRGAAAAARNIADDLAATIRYGLQRYPSLAPMLNETRDLAEDARLRADLEAGFVHVGRLP